MVTDTDMDALLEIVQSGESVVHDTSMPDRQVERSCSCESRDGRLLCKSLCMRS